MDIPRNISKWKRRLIRGLYTVVILGILTLITVGVYRLQPADPIIERTAIVIDAVKRGSLFRQVRGYGKLVPEEMHWVPAVTEGRIERILVHPGALVRPDTLLVEMSNAELELDVSTAEMAVRAAEADYTNLRVQLEKEILDQKSVLATVQADYYQATMEAQLNEELAQSGLISDQQLELSKNRAQAFTTRFEIEKSRVDISTEAVQAQLAAQAARVDQYRVVAQLKQDQKTSLKVRPGKAGVLALLQVEEGQQVKPGTNLARIANPARLKAELKITETQAKDIQIGQQAKVDTHNGIISGHVVRIDPTVQGGSVTVDVTLDEPLPKGARPDLSVDGTIELEHLEDVLFVGRPVFSQEKRLLGLFRVEEESGRASRVQVQFGRMSVNSIEVLGGLNMGDRVILSDMSAWDDFERVRLD